MRGRSRRNHKSRSGNTRVHRLGKSAEDGRAAGQGFKAALVAAVAFRAADLNDHVPDFPGGASEAGIQFAVQYDAPAYARAQENADDMPRFGGQLRLINSQHGGVGVVFHEDGQAQRLFQRLFQRHVLPFQVGGEKDPAVPGIYSAGRADANGLDLLEVQVAFIHCVPHAAGDALDHFFRPALTLGAEFGAAQAIEFPVKQAGQDLGPAQVNPREVFPFFGCFRHGYLAARTLSMRWRSSMLIS